MLSKKFYRIATVGCVVLLVLSLSSCKSKRAVVSDASGTTTQQQETTDADTKEGKKEAKIIYKPTNQSYATLKASVTVSMPSIMSLPLKATISANVGKELMISVKPLLGIEMYRMVLTQDSVIVLDRIKHQYVAEPYSKFVDKNYNLNYGMIEGLLLNRYFDPLQEDYKDLEVTKQGEITILRKNAKNYYVEFVSTNTLNRLLFSKNDGKESIMADYSAFNSNGSYNFPGNAVCSVTSAKMNFSAEITFNEVVFNEQVSIAYSIPSSYSKSSIESFLK